MDRRLQPPVYGWSRRAPAHQRRRRPIRGHWASEPPRAGATGGSGSLQSSIYCRPQSLTRAVHVRKSLGADLWQTSIPDMWFDRMFFLDGHVYQSVTPHLKSLVTATHGVYRDRLVSHSPPPTGALSDSGLRFLWNAGAKIQDKTSVATITTTRMVTEI